MTDQEVVAVVNKLTEEERRQALEMVAVIVKDQLALERSDASERNFDAIEFSKVDAYQHLRKYLVLYLPELEAKPKRKRNPKTRAAAPQAKEAPAIGVEAHRLEANTVSYSL
jgi:hypothetical protein